VPDENKSPEVFTPRVPATIDRQVLAGPHANQLPLDDMVVRFPE